MCVHDAEGCDLVQVACLLSLGHQLQMCPYPWHLLQHIGLCVSLVMTTVLEVFPRLELCRLGCGKWQDSSVAMLSTTNG